MTFIQAIDAVVAAVQPRTTNELETLAREVPINAPTTDHGAVGAGIERVLRDRYSAAWADKTDAEIFHLGYAFPGGTYRDRVDRARCDAASRLLEGRHEGEPFDTFPYADNVQEAPEGAWREHVSQFYGVPAV